jgi:heme oxygenase
MTPLEKVRKGVDAALRDVEAVKAVLEGRSDRATYVRYLKHVANQYAPHSPKVMALAAARCLDAHPELGSYLLRHAAEEQGHGSWAHDDLLALGESAGKVKAARPVLSCAALIGYAYYLAEHANPVSLFGWMFVLEAVGSDLGAEAAAGLKKGLGLGDDAVHFVAGHGKADRTHTRELAEQISRHVTAARDRADVLHAAEVSADLYVRMFREISPGGRP